MTGFWFELKSFWDLNDEQQACVKRWAEHEGEDDYTEFNYLLDGKGIDVMRLEPIRFDDGMEAFGSNQGEQNDANAILR